MTDEQLYHSQMPDDDELIEMALVLIRNELPNARRKFPTFHSRHEAHAVLRQEVDELWDAIKSNEPTAHVQIEAKQVAAMALRMMIEITLPEICEQTGGCVLPSQAEIMGLEPDDKRVKCWFCTHRVWDEDENQAICDLGDYRMWNPVKPRMCADFVMLPPERREPLR